MSQKPSNNKRILLLSSSETAEDIAKVETFIQTLNGELATNNLAVEWCNYHDLGLEFNRQKLRGFITSTSQDITDFAAVYFKSYFRYIEQATALAEVLRMNHVTFVGSELHHYIADDKLSQMARLARAGLPIPHTIHLPLERYVSQYEQLANTLGKQFIFKAIDGKGGDDNHQVRSRAEFAKIVANGGGRKFIAQAFIPNDSDLRFLIVGGELKLIIKRSRQTSDTHLNNTSQGARAELLKLADCDQSLCDMALRAAKLMDREVAGVDIMLELGTGKPYILEVNASPQIASGAFEAEKMAVYTKFFKEIVV